MCYKQLLVFALAAVGCNDKDGDTAGYIADGDSGDARDPISTDCFWQTESDAYDLDEAAPTAENETCSTHSLGATATDWVDGTGAVVHDVSVYGHYDAMVPDVGIGIRAWRIEHEWEWKGDPITYPGSQVTTITKDVTEAPSGMGYDWFATFLSEDELDGFDDCEDHCEFYDFGTEIPDEHTALLDYCALYDSSSDEADHDDMEVCLSWDRSSIEPAPPPEAHCTAGRGTFQLIPMDWQDYNADGFRLEQWRPVMSSGRGALTGSANITKVKLHDDNGAPMRVIHKNQTYWFSEEDELEGVTARNSTLLASGVNKNFTRSQLPGSPVFISEDYPARGKYDMEVDLTWTCPTTTSVARTPPPAEPQGYSFSLADIGCALTQKVTVRPMVTASEPYAEIELYGTKLHSVKVHLGVDNGVYYFDGKSHGVRMAGHFDRPPTNPADGLKVTFTDITYRGADQCELGTYTFAKEQ